MILSCQNICKSFGEKVILQDASFHIEDREKAALIGNNGAGKTTLLCPRRSSGAKKPPSPMPWATAWWTTSRSTPRACTPMRSSSSAGQTTRPTVCPSPRRACSTARSSRNTTTTRAAPSSASGCRTRHGPAATSTILLPVCWQTTALPAYDPFFQTAKDGVSAPGTPPFCLLQIQFIFHQPPGQEEVCRRNGCSHGKAEQAPTSLETCCKYLATVCFPSSALT